MLLNQIRFERSFWAFLVEGEIFKEITKWKKYRERERERETTIEKGSERERETKNSLGNVSKKMCLCVGLTMCI